MTRLRRALVVCFVVLTTSGLAPAAVLGVEDLRGCRGECPFCLCARRPPTAGVRAPCACCQPTPAAPDPLRGVALAVLPPGAFALADPPPCDLGSPRTGGPAEFSPSVPHPPPRTQTTA
jgi:hypothetical protein